MNGDSEQEACLLKLPRNYRVTDEAVLYNNDCFVFVSMQDVLHLCFLLCLKKKKKLFRLEGNRRKWQTLHMCEISH